MLRRKETNCAMMSLKNFLVGAAVLKVGTGIIINIIIFINIMTIIKTIKSISFINIMPIKVGFLSYAGYKIAACNCSGLVKEFLAAPFSLCFH